MTVTWKNLFSLAITWSWLDVHFVFFKQAGDLTLSTLHSPTAIVFRCKVFNMEKSLFISMNTLESP
jgi:hypothetical protein